MRKKLLSAILFSMCVYSSQLQALGCDNRFAIQSAIVTGGNFGIGIANYSNIAEYGLTVSGTWNNASHDTRLFIPAIFGGFRHLLGEYTFFAYGLDLASKFGRENGMAVNADVFAAPYISLEQALTSHLLLVGWVNPYSFEYEKRGGVSVTTQKFFGSGGLGLSYLF